MELPPSMPESMHPWLVAAGSYQTCSCLASWGRAVICPRVLGTVPSSYSTLTTTLRCRCHHPHFAREDTKVQLV